MNASRVLMTADAVGGVWTFALELAASLAAHGVSTDLAVMGPAPTLAQRREAAPIPGLRLHAGHYRLEWMDDCWDSVSRAGEWLLELERRIRPDVVHLNGYVHGSLPWSAPVVITGHSCVLSWWTAVHGAPPRTGWGTYAAAVRCGLGAAHRVTAPTNVMLDSLRLHYGPIPPGSVIPNGRSPRFQRGPKLPRILAAGRAWDRAKNVAALDRVAKRLPWPVLIAGDVAGLDGRSASWTSARPLGLLGKRRLASELAHASIFAHPAVYEPFGLSALEAGLSGCALVLGDIPSLREVWGDAAVYVPPRSESALEAALRRLIEDPAARGEYAARALERASAYTPERMARAYLDVYAGAMKAARLRSESPAPALA